ncbi:MAG: TonB-dependent receptor [Rhizomicrobium sp.]|jgi:iron complex outermembrane receptor protein
MPLAARADDSVETVIVTGTRTTGMKAADSAAPIQIVGVDVLQSTGQPDVMQALSQNVPSFQAQGYGADTAALTLSAALRGLNPDDTLVLVDGKRRNPTANLQVDGGSPYQGAASTDLSFIPEAAIDHIEVLQDGAAAQYGSDAIGGVVNIIMKSNDSGGTISATGGQYFEGDGDTAGVSINKGFNLDDRGFINFTFEERYHDFSRQGGADYRFSNPNGTIKPGLSSIDETNIPLTPGYPDMNNIYGDPQYNLYNGFYNAGYKLGGGVEFYSFGSYGYREDSSYENYRKPDKVVGVTAPTVACPTGCTYYPLPYGFSPREGIDEIEYSFTAGFKGEFIGWSWDLSSTYGKDNDQVYTLDSANAQLFPVLAALSPTPITAQRNFYDGSYDDSQWTDNIDISRDFNIGLASPVNVAFGGEAMRDTFAIGQGEPSSYYGAGAQSFTGYTPSDAGNHERNSYAGYVDVAGSVLPGLFVDLAGRFEHYSDFGQAIVGKATVRYDFNDKFAIRGTVSSGFRAPTLQEEYYSGTNVSPAFAQVQLPPNSPAAVIAGFGPLKPELSQNYSAGFVAHPSEDLQFTLDAYQIDIEHRIVGSGFLLGEVLNNSTTPPSETVVSQAILNAIAAHGNVLDSGISYAGIQLFTNGVATITRGVEATANYATDFGGMGHVDWTAGFNYNDTTIVKIAPLPSVDYNAAFDQTALLSRNATSSLVDATPKFKVVLNAHWIMDKWSVNLREDIYGPTSQWVSIDGSGTGPLAVDTKIGTSPVTDIDIGYHLTEWIRLDIGANNLFDLKPPTVPNVNNGGTLQPADGNNVYGEPDQYSPFGINGGYYYGRVTINF